MDKQFSTWYRVVSVDPRPETLTARWAGVDKFVADASTSEFFEVIRIMFRRPATSAVVEKLETALQSEDLSFRIGNNDVELAVMAGACLMALIHNPEDERRIPAVLGILGGNLRGRGYNAILPVFVEEALRARATASTRIGSLSWPRVVARAPKFENANISGDPATFIKNLQSAFRADAESLKDFAAALRESLDPLVEANEITWWLMGEFSRDLETPVTSLGVPAAAVIIGKELADITRGIPGPRSARAFLHRMLSLFDDALLESVTLGEAVDATPRSWRESWCSGLASSVTDLTPVHLAGTQSLQVTEPKDWFALFRKSTELDPELSLSPLDLAIQVYDEALALRTLASTHEEEKERPEE